MSFYKYFYLSIALLIISANTYAKQDKHINPLLTESALFLHYPVFDKIQNTDYAPAFEAGMQQQLQKIDAIANNTEAATFENTLIALEKSGVLLGRTSRIFFALSSANTNDEIEALRKELSPKLAQHQDAILLNKALFHRIKSLYVQREKLALPTQDLRLLEQLYKDFVLSGALLTEKNKDKVKKINAKIAQLQTQFSQNVLKEVNAQAIIVDNEIDLDGLSTLQIAAAKQAAKARDMPNKYVIALLNTSGQPALSTLKNRALRKRIYETSISRGSQGGAFDNRAILAQVAKLRAQRAQILGHTHHASYTLSDQTAKNVDNVNNMLAKLTPTAVNNAKIEAKKLQSLINETEKTPFTLQPWDWSFYTEKLRQKEYAFNAEQIKPYLEMQNVLENGVFYAAKKLYGLSFKQRTDLPVYHPDVKVWEVFNENGETLALFIQDFYARQSKRGGAWMNAYVSQSKLNNNKAVVANHLNIPKPPKGEATLLTWDEVETMFHEFGHALHGMFSNVKYSSVSGTNVPRDFVEYPSQVNEMWATWPEVLQNYAKHYKTGAPIPKELLDKMQASAQFNQGFATTEYLAAALLDQAWHQLEPSDVPNEAQVLNFEKSALQKAGALLSQIPPRYRSTYFSHIIGGYSAGYYSYIWSEVLDADTVAWFEENGGLTRENGDHFRATLLSKGNTSDAMDLYKNFRGKNPDISYLIKRKGLEPKK